MAQGRHTEDTKRTQGRHTEDTKRTQGRHTENTTRTQGRHTEDTKRTQGRHMEDTKRPQTGPRLFTKPVENFHAMENNVLMTIAISAQVSFSEFSLETEQSCHRSVTHRHAASERLDVQRLLHLAACAAFASASSMKTLSCLARPGEHL